MLKSNQSKIKKLTKKSFKIAKTKNIAKKIIKKNLNRKKVIKKNRYKYEIRSEKLANSKRKIYKLQKLYYKKNIETQINLYKKKNAKFMYFKVRLLPISAKIYSIAIISKKMYYKYNLKNYYKHI